MADTKTNSKYFYCKDLEIKTSHNPKKELILDGHFVGEHVNLVATSDCRGGWDEVSLYLTKNELISLKEHIESLLLQLA